MSSGSDSINVGSLAERVAHALNRRVGEGRPISTKQFAYEMRASVQTVWLWQGGRRPPTGEYFVRMLAFFPADFANEVLAPAGCVLVKLSDIRASQAFRDLNAARENAIRALNGTQGE